MKTIIRKTAIFAFVILSLVASLASCFGGVDSDGKCTVVLANGDEVQEYEVDLGSLEGDEGLFSVLQVLNEDGMPLVTSVGAFGRELHSVGSLVPDATAREYVQIFTSVEADFDTSTWFLEIDYKGTRLGTSGFGASQMKIVDGGIYYLTIATY